MAVCCALAFSGVLMQSPALAKAKPKPADFSGDWVLDTSQTKNLPQGLRSYSMRVKQNPNQLQVKTVLKGDLLPPGGMNGPYPDAGVGNPGRYPGNYPGSMGRMGRMGRMGGMGMPIGGAGGGPMSEGIPGMPASGGGRPRSMGRSGSKSAGFTLYPKEAVYKLNGNLSTAELGGPEHEDATAKAEWAKGGKLLKLSLQSSGDSRTVEVKDQWKLSKDGQSLLIDRSVHSPRGSATLHLVFHKQTAAASQMPS
ncbi:MAG: hypothetical protein ACRD2B_03075 [Terriglobia bacterium]